MSQGAIRPLLGVPFTRPLSSQLSSFASRPFRNFLVPLVAVFASNVCGRLPGCLSLLQAGHTTSAVEGAAETDSQMMVLLARFAGWLTTTGVCGHPATRDSSQTTNGAVLAVLQV